MTSPDENAVFLVSGGARGITARCVVEMARAFRCGFILIGRTSIEDAEPSWAAGCDDEPELKRRIAEALRAKGEAPAPQRIQDLHREVRSRREVAQTLRAVGEAGGRAVYVRADVTDLEALREGLSEAVREVGPVTGIVHGAGALADRRIEQKTGRDFDAVYDAKVTGLKNLLTCAPPGGLSHLVLFGSAAGFYGNAGQTDYALANEVLNKAAHLLQRRHPGCRVVVLNWGPWDGGMVTPERKALFEKRGIPLIPSEAGARLLVEELRHGDAVQVLAGSPFLRPAVSPDPTLNTHRIRRRLTASANPFLKDHIIGGRAVLPTVCAMAWVANACEQVYPGHLFFAFEDFCVLKGIVFDDTLADAYLLDLKETDRGAGEVAFRAEIRSEGTPVRRHYSAQVTLRAGPSRPPNHPFDSGRDWPDARPADPLYQDGTLFHGPTFRGVRRILSLNEAGVVLECRLPAVDEAAQGQFPAQTFNPFTADLLLQSLVIWARHTCDAASLPLKCQRVEQFRPLPFDRPFYVSLSVRSHAEHALIADVAAHDAQGRVHTLVTGAEVTVSRQLNPLFVSRG